MRNISYASKVQNPQENMYGLAIGNTDILISEIGVSLNCKRIRSYIKKGFPFLSFKEIKAMLKIMHRLLQELDLKAEIEK